MTFGALAKLDEIARTDETVAPLARLQAIALAEPPWDNALPDLSDHRLAEGVPLLHGRVLTPDAGAARRLFDRLCREAGIVVASETPLPSLLAAALQMELAELTDAAALLATLALLPITRAAGLRAAPLLADVMWDAGCCPVCAAWPTLAEQRGLDRERWLRCGRCASGWKFPHGLCPYCANVEGRTQSYLAADAERATRRATTCERCRGYLKTIAVITPTPIEELAALDLETIELDVAALDRGYGRPPGLGFPLEVDVRSAEKRSWRAGLREALGR